MGLAIDTKVSAIYPGRTLKRSMGQLYGSLDLVSSSLQIEHGAGNSAGLTAAETIRENVQDLATWPA